MQDIHELQMEEEEKMNLSQGKRGWMKKVH